MVSVSIPSDNDEPPRENEHTKYCIHFGFHFLFISIEKSLHSNNLATFEDHDNGNDGNDFHSPIKHLF